MKSITKFVPLLILFFICGCAKKWFVNDQSREGDVFAKAVGDKEKANGSKKRPFASIQEAIQKALPGDTILIDAGHYSEFSAVGNVAVLIDKPKINLEGAGPEKTIIQLPIDKNYFGVKIVTTNIQVKNLSIKGGSVGVFIDQAEQAIIKNVWVENQTSQGFSLDQAHNNEISQCKVQKSESLGFGFHNSTFNRIYNNLSQDNDIAGFYLSESSDNEFKRNSAKNNGKSGFFLCVSNFNNKFENNQAIANGAGGLYLHGGSAKNYLSNNLSQSNGVGISINNSHSNIIINNQINSNKWNGIFLKNGSSFNQVLNNRLKNNQAPQIRVSEKNPKNNEIKNNVIEQDKLSQAGLTKKEALAIADAYAEERARKDNDEFDLKNYPNRKAVFDKDTNEWMIFYARNRRPGDHFAIYVHNLTREVRLMPGA